MSCNEEQICVQLQQLQKHQHIEHIKETRQNTFEVEYNPHSTHSPYSHMVFTIKIKLPKNYPQSPPSLTFMDKIYHLNVNQIQGNVYMPILKDDWSPYLTLNDVISSLDSILEEPDMNFPATPEMLQLYTDHPHKYQEKVQTLIKFALHSNKQIEEQAEQQSISNKQFVEIAESLGNIENNNNSPEVQHFHEMSHNPTNISFERHDINQEQNIHFSQEQQVKSNERKSLNEIQQNHHDNQQSNVQKQQNNLPENNYIKIELSSARSKIPSKIAKQSSKIQNKQSPKKKRTQVFTKYQDMTISLKQTNQLIDVFLAQCEVLENRVHNSQNLRVKKLMEDNLEKQWVMLEQLMKISSDLKGKLMKQIKKDASEFLQ